MFIHRCRCRVRLIPGTYRNLKTYPSRWFDTKFYAYNKKKFREENGIQANEQKRKRKLIWQRGWEMMPCSFSHDKHNRNLLVYVLFSQQYIYFEPARAAFRCLRAEINDNIASASYRCQRLYGCNLLCRSVISNFYTKEVLCAASVVAVFRFSSEPNQKPEWHKIRTQTHTHNHWLGH